LPEKEFEYSERTVDGRNDAVALDLQGGLFVSNLNDFREIFSIFPSKGVSHIILNCSQLDFIGSTAIGILVESSDRLANKNVMV
jgi:anti-anti-sigma factor